MHRCRIEPYLLSMLVLLGCGGAPSADGWVERVDSAGVEIVRSGGPGRPLPWSFEELTSIGGIDDRHAAFSRVWPHGIGADSAGNIYVLDAPNHHVTIFDSTGKYLRTLGREGGGPGEFMAASALSVLPDGRIAVYDHGKRGLVWFGADRKVLESEPLPVPYRGGAIRITSSGMHLPVRSILESENSREHRLLFVAGSDTLPLVSEVRPRGRPIRYESCGMLSLTLPPLFTPDFVWDAQHEIAAVVRGADYVIDVFRAGELIRSIRRATPPRPVTEEIALAAVGDGEEWSWANGRCRVAPEEVVEKRAYADRLPAIQDLTVVPTGALWVKPWSEPGKQAAIDVFSTAGEYQGRLPPGSPWPARFLSEEVFAAIETDDLGVVRVNIYRVSRN